MYTADSECGGASWKPVSFLYGVDRLHCSLLRVTMSFFDMVENLEQTTCHSNWISNHRFLNFHYFDIFNLWYDYNQYILWNLKFTEPWYLTPSEMVENHKHNPWIKKNTPKTDNRSREFFSYYSNSIYSEAPPRTCRIKPIIPSYRTGNWNRDLLVQRPQCKLLGHDPIFSHRICGIHSCSLRT